MTTTTNAQLLSAHNCGSHSKEWDLDLLAKAVDLNMAPAIMIETTYQGPTSTKGSRIKATMLGTSYAHTIGLDHSLTTTQAHLKAALSMLSGWFEGERLVPAGYSDTKKGFVFSFAHEA